MGIFFVIIAVFAFATLCTFAFSKNFDGTIRLIVSYSCLSLMGVCNILYYCFGPNYLFNLIVGLILVVEPVVLACIVLYRER